MKVLIDTHVFLWIFGGRKLSDKVREYFENADENEFYFSHIAAWEISIKYGLGKLVLPDKPELFIPDRIRRSGFRYLQIDLPHVMQVHSLPKIHRDPFDRLLISQAKIEGMSICSDDPIFKRYKINTFGLRTIS